MSSVRTLNKMKWLVCARNLAKDWSDHPADVKVTTEGEISIGGPFTLVDHEGVERNSVTDYGGKFMLIYFGFTFCPDICPTELTKMAEVINRLGMTRSSSLWGSSLIT
jgi:protein SCO1